eukprot:CAMPEP_0174912424 /NCGR_PEP_ID=MMETSP0167-20121228/79776_1 /TAXON_ID=38298 /ORGANISM="Rhodella maculata, Strain CCMP736" /LENGTH=110 /DNA_ID=CAMNT_0016157073 /DNA_START=1242 /DNA_END=1574 /DNA_ORIENTATION=-
MSGGMRPCSVMCLYSSATALATSTGFFTPVSAPTAPNLPDDPSMTHASHSTVPACVIDEPVPAFVSGQSSRARTASTAASIGLLHVSRLALAFWSAERIAARSSDSVLVL